MATAAMEIVVPLHHREESQLSSLAPLLRLTSDSDVYIVHIQASRVLWSTLHPCLLRSSSNTTSEERVLRTVQFLLKQPYCFRYSGSSLFKRERTCRNEGERYDDDEAANAGADDTPKDPLIGFDRRTIHNPTNPSTTPSILLLLPPSTTPLSYNFPTRLNSLEHRLVRASSISHYMATLGGGFFFCRHYTTAAQLALHQHAVAQHVLHDPRLAATCWIHLAYNCAYRGVFDAAETILARVQAQWRLTDTEDDDPLSAMCASAALLCRRMRETHHRIQGSSESAAPAPTVDDYLRIRVLQDQSYKGGGAGLVTSLIDTTQKELYQRQQ